MKNTGGSTDEGEEVFSDSPSINESVETPIPTFVLLVLSIQIHTKLPQLNEVQNLAEKPFLYD